MSNNEIIDKLTELQELKRMQEELSAAIEAIQDTVKAFMGDSELLSVGPYKVTYKPITSTRIDTTALKRELPDVAARFSKASTVRRFMVQ